MSSAVDKLGKAYQEASAKYELSKKSVDEKQKLFDSFKAHQKAIDDNL
jgi:ABC-type transporter Mla subunit MlaD